MSQFMHHNLQREYVLYQPSNVKKGCPLVVFLHWYTGSSEDVINFIGFNEIADKYGFAVVYPEGTLDKYQTKHWNANLDLSDTDDIGFISALVKMLQEKHHYNPKNTFVMGISNGGFMTYTLALHTPKLFAAYAPVIGTMSGKDWEERTFQNPVPIFHISGLDDELVPFDGSGSLEDGWGGAPSIETVVDYWAEINQCAKPLIENLTKNSTLVKHQKGVNNHEVWLLKIKNHGHDFPTKDADVNGGELIWEFFSMYIK